MDPDDAHEWAYIPHFYWKYYVFVYATGLASGLAVSDLVVQGEPQRDAYLQMLSAGCAEPPLDLLNAAGVDLTTPAPIEAAVKVLDETLTQLEALLPRLAADDQASESGQ
jgi:oligoendopeptidase F